MGTYQYIAKNATGEQVAGTMQGDSEAAVLRTLDERDLYPVEVSETSVKLGGRRRGRIRVREVGVMYGQLSDLLRAGVPMLRALETLAKAVPNPHLKQTILHVRDDVSAGKTLAEAMTAQPKAFTSLHAAMVRAGEEAGFLEDVLANLSAFLERVDDLRSKVRGALVYPLMLTLFGAAAMIFILVFLVPQFKTVFSDMPLPLPTTILFGLSDLMLNRWPLMLGLVVLTVIGVRAFLISDYGRQAWDRWRLKIPVLGRVLRMVSITRFCRILGTMLGNGVPIIQALTISKDAAGCTVLAKSIEDATENVRAGEPLAEPLRASGIFPVEIIEMIAVAEESNQLEKVLVEIADTVERRTNRQVDVAVRLVEPIILVIIAAAIGLMALGLYYPIFNMAQMIK